METFVVRVAAAATSGGTLHGVVQWVRDGSERTFTNSDELLRLLCVAAEYRDDEPPAHGAPGP